MLITKHKAAELLGISPYTLRVWREKGTLIEGLHYQRFNTQNVRYIQESIIHLANNRHDPDAHRRYCQERINQINNAS